MKQILQNYNSGDLELNEVPVPSVKPIGVLVRNHHSLVSAGTEKAMIKLAKKSLAGKARERPDLVKEVINKAKNDGLMATYQAVMTRLDEPNPLGYSCAGEVTEVGREVEDFSTGDLVACGGAGYASHAEVVNVPGNLTVQVPDDVTTKEASFVTLGAIALQGIRRAELTPGERVGVIGLGLIGQLTVQILKAYGFPVIGLDIDEKQVQRVQKLGLNESGTIGQDKVESLARNFSNGKGIDAVIITAATETNQPVELAGKLCRERGRVSAVGLVGTEVPRDIYYDKELDFNISRSYGPGRYDKTYEEKGLSYPIGQVRWTERRNMKEFLRLVQEDKVNLDPLITHEFKFENALDAYDLILENPNGEYYSGIVLEYDTDKKHSSKILLEQKAKGKIKGDTVNVGLIGAGNFAKSKIIPNLEKINEAELKALATATGKTAKDVGGKHGFEYCTTEYSEIIEDPDVDLVVIATRHNLHAEMTAEALSKDKNVHVEKPLALNQEELKDVTDAEQNSDGRLMVGFNRRFAPQVQEVKDKLEDSNTPLMINYRVNAGYIEPDHWIHDPEEGGGRIIGEVCHFVDLIQFLVNAQPEKIYASRVPPQGEILPDDNVSVNIDFADGSRGAILYTALGDKSLPKEYIEIFGDRKAESINNFKTGTLSLKQDKGHFGEFVAFVDSILNGEPSPISIKELALSTFSTFKILDSIRSGKPQNVYLDSN